MQILDKTLEITLLNYRNLGGQSLDYRSYVLLLQCTQGYFQFPCLSCGMAYTDGYFLLLSQIGTRILRHILTTSGFLFPNSGSLGDLYSLNLDFYTTTSSTYGCGLLGTFFGFRAAKREVRRGLEPPLESGICITEMGVETLESGRSL